MRIGLSISHSVGRECFLRMDKVLTLTPALKKKSKDCTEEENGHFKF